MRDFVRSVGRWLPVLTLLGATLLILPLKIHNRPWQILLSVLWGLFVVVWFGVGLTQIADWTALTDVKANKITGANAGGPGQLPMRAAAYG